jgi:hypothetical protein
MPPTMPIPRMIAASIFMTISCSEVVTLAVPADEQHRD